MKRYLLVAILLFTMTASAEAAGVSNQFVQVHFLEKVNTPFGLLEIVKEKDAEYTFDIVLAGKQVDQITEPSASFYAVYPSVRATRIALIGLDSGGFGCPLMYRIVEIKSKNTVVVTDQFGNCNAVDKISYKDGIWYFRIPRPGRNPPQFWIYSKGKVTKVEKGGRQH